MIRAGKLASWESPGKVHLPLALVVRERNLLELAMLEDGGGREERGSLLNECLGSHGDCALKVTRLREDTKWRVGGWLGWSGVCDG